MLISSLAGYFGLPVTPSYCASKAAVKAYGEALRGWLAPDALIYLEREKEMSDLPLPASWQQLKDNQAGQVCYQLYLRDTKDDAAV